MWILQGGGEVYSRKVLISEEEDSGDNGTYDEVRVGVQKSVSTGKNGLMWGNGPN